jgi:glycosyltransferase involved in cell wall biosynthesis
LDSDDKLIPNILKTYINFAQKYPNVGVFYGNHKLIGDYTAFGRDEIVYLDYYQKNSELLARMVVNNQIACGGSFVKKQLYLDFGGYHPDFKRVQDYEFWTKIIDKTLFKHIETVSYIYRWHDDNITAIITDTTRDLSYEARVLTRLLQRYPLESLFFYHDWEKRSISTVLSYLEIAKTYAKWDDSEYSLYYYNNAFEIMGLTDQKNDFNYIKNTLKQIFTNSEILNSHTEMIEKFIQKPQINNNLTVKIVNNTKKILFVVHDFPPYNIAGIQLYAIKMAKGLNKFENIEVEILHPVFTDKITDYRIEKTLYEGINVYRLYKPADPEYSLEKIKNLKVGMVFRQFLTENQYDLIHFHSMGQLSVSVAEIAQDMDIPNVFTIHDKWFLCYNWHQITTDVNICTGKIESGKCAKCILIKYDYNQNQYQETIKMLDYRQSEFKKVFINFDEVYAVSEYSKKCLSEYFPREIIVNHIGFAELNYQKQYVKKEKITFGYLGRIVMIKGIHLLIKAFTKLPNPNIELMIFGHIQAQNMSYIEYLKELAQNDNRIKFCSEYSADDLEDIMSGIDIVVIPSLIENFPLIAIESFQYRVPVIASDVGGIPEIVKNEVNGLLFKNNNQYDLFKKMEYVINNKNIIQHLSKNCAIPREVNDDIKWHRERYLSLLTSI